MLCIFESFFTLHLSDPSRLWISTPDSLFTPSPVNFVLGEPPGATGRGGGAQAAGAAPGGGVGGLPWGWFPAALSIRPVSTLGVLVVGELLHLSRSDSSHRLQPRRATGTTG